MSEQARIDGHHDKTFTLSMPADTPWSTAHRPHIAPTRKALSVKGGSNVPGFFVGVLDIRLTAFMTRYKGLGITYSLARLEVNACLQ